MRLNYGEAAPLSEIMSYAERRLGSLDARRWNAAEEKLKASRQKYLQHTILLQELDDLASFASNESAAAFAAPEPLAVPSDAAKTLMRRLQVARVMQQAKLTPPGDTSTAHAIPATNEEAGSLDHVLGVDGDALVQLHLRSDKNEKAQADVILAALERRLQARVGGMRMSLGAAGKASKTEGPCSIPVPAAERVARRSEELKDSREDTFASLQQLLEGAMKCAQLLTRTHAFLAAFIQRNLLEKQQTLDQFNVDLTLAHCRSLAYKLGTVKLQLMAATYTRDNVAALAVLAGHIRKALTETQASLGQVTKQLSMYENLGPQFDAVVQEYSRVKGELVQAQARLDIFNQMENELPG